MIVALGMFFRGPRCFNCLEDFVNVELDFDMYSQISGDIRQDSAEQFLVTQPVSNI